MKIKRSKKNYGGGSGSEIYNSDLFRVVLWNSQGGQNTGIECSLLLNDEIILDGIHNINSDVQCLEQYELKEILEIIKAQKENGIEEGKRIKILEFQKCLES